MGPPLLGQVQLEDRILPRDQQSLHIELQQLQKIALGCKRAADDQHVDVSVPVKEFAMSLNRRYHAGHNILSPEQALCFRLEARPGTGREIAQQLAVEARVRSQTLEDDQDDLPMCDGRADLVSNVERGQQRPLLVARGAGTALLAGEGDEHLVLAVRAANSSKPFLQIPTLKKGRHRLLDDRPPETVLGLISLVVDLLERVKMLIAQPPQVGVLGIAWAVERQGLDLSQKEGIYSATTCPVFADSSRARTGGMFARLLASGRNGSPPSKTMRSIARN